MNKSGSRPVRTARTVLVLELEVPSSGRLDWVRVCVSRAGGEGSLSHLWETRDGRLTPDTWNDLQCFLLKSLSTTLELMGGVQTILPGME